MNKKTGLQAIMVLVIIFISLWFYLKYFTENFEDVKETQVKEKNDENKRAVYEKLVTRTMFGIINAARNSA